MLKSETGVSALRQLFEENQQSQRRDGLKRMASLERTHAQERLHTSKKETHEKEFIKVLERDISTNTPPDQKVNKGSTSEIDKYDEREADSTGEYIPIKIDSGTIAALDNAKNQLIKMTNGFENEQANKKVTEQTDASFGSKADQSTTEQNKEYNLTNTGPIVTKQIDRQNTTSLQDQAALNNSTTTKTSVEEPIEEGFMDNGSAGMVDTLQRKPNDSQIVGKRAEVTEVTTNAFKHNKDDSYDEGDQKIEVLTQFQAAEIYMNQEDTIKQASSRNAMTYLDKKEANKIHETEPNGKGIQYEIKPMQSANSNIAEKSIKPPLPPKPTTCVKANTSQKKHSNNGTTEKRNDEHHAHNSAKNFARMRKTHRLSRFDTRSSTTDSVISSTTASSEESMDKDVQYMVEVYRDLIKHQVKVDDLLPLLTLLGQDDTAIIKSKQKACPPDAVELLLDVMAMSDIPGIWQSFLDALETLEYVHLSQLLRNETETHHRHSSNILKLVTHDLKQRICMPEFLDAVYERGLLVQSEYEEANAVNRARGSYAAAGVIIEGVDKHLPNWDVLFADVLEQSGMADIAELFKLIDQQPAYCLQGERFSEEKGTKQKKLRHQRIQNWDITSELQTTLNEAGFDVRNKVAASNKSIESNMNALCITVSQIQSDVKLLLKLWHGRKESDAK